MPMFLQFLIGFSFIAEISVLVFLIRKSKEKRLSEKPNIENIVANLKNWANEQNRIGVSRKEIEDKLILEGYSKSTILKVIGLLKEEQSRGKIIAIIDTENRGWSQGINKKI